MSLATRALSRSFKGRLYSTAAAQAESKSFGDRDNEPKCYVKKLNNGMLVGTIETQSPVSRLAVVANAGSRFETGDALGVSHFLRLSTKLRTENMSALGITRATQQLGSDVTIMGTREYLYYKSSVTRNCVPKMVEVLRELTTKQVYKPWEVSDLQSNTDSLLLDLAILETQPHIRAVDLLHAAAFRDTLGRSLYAPEFMLGKYHPDQLTHFVKSYFSAGRMALVGVGVDHGELEELAQQFEPHATAGVPTEKATYHGGEIRDNTGGELAHVAVGCEGPSLTSQDLLPAEVLRKIMGTGPHIKYSSGVSVAQLGKAVSQATDAPFHVSCLNANYTDSGLFGFTAVAHASQIEKVVRAAANQFFRIASNLSEADVTRAKKQLKAEMCMQFENPDVLLNWLGEQTLNSDQILTPQEIYKMVDKVTTSDVSAIAKKILSSRVSMAAVGNVSSVPYADKLMSK